MRAYSPDLRQRVLADCDRGLTTRVVATKYSVSESWVWKPWGYVKVCPSYY